MYDLHNHLLLKNSFEALQHFSLSGVGVTFSDSYDSKKFSELKQKALQSNKNLDIVSCIELHASRSGELKNKIDKFSGMADVILVHAKEPNAVRAAAESSDVDIISHAFIDEVTAVEAAKNNVAIEINLRDILSMYSTKRAILLSKINFNLELARKHGIKIVISTGAQSLYDMRSPKQIIALAECIGFTHKEAKKAVFETPKKIVEGNRAKRMGKIIAEGVKILR